MGAAGDDGFQLIVQRVGFIGECLGFLAVLDLHQSAGGGDTGASSCCFQKGAPREIEALQKVFITGLVVHLYCS